MRNRWMDLALPVAILACIVVIYVPLPTDLIDVLLAANLALAVTMLLTAVLARSPLEMSAFPALLLVLTLGRLALNVATTRLILTRGHLDQELAAGHVIRGFAEFVAGDQLVVGMIIFGILFVVQFLVITKGATRIGEVAARFSLDGLPGRQMAIDADLNAGLIDLEQAQQRRRELLRYADFHGSMDGASKYVRGDALASLVITAVNIAGGLAIGMYYNLSLEQAARTFTLLTIGDGLVTQLPALLISIAAGLLVSRGSHESDLPRDSLAQLFGRPIVLWLTAGFLAVLATTNLPTIPLLALAGTSAIAGWIIHQRRDDAISPSVPVPAPPREASIDRLLAGDVLELQLGAGLVALADAQQRGTLLSEVSGVRQRIAGDLGLVLPKVRIRDNLRLPTRVFQILLHGEQVLIGEAHPDQLLAQGAESSLPDAMPCELPWVRQGHWIAPQHSESLPAGSVLTATQAIAESLCWVARNHAAELLSRDATSELIEESKKTYPALIRELTDRAIPLARVQHILGLLVREGVSIRHLGRILEVAVDEAPQATDWEIAEKLRLVLRRQTSQRLRNDLGVLRAMAIAPELAGRLAGCLDASTPPRLILADENLARLEHNIDIGMRQFRLSRSHPVLIAPASLRRPLAEALAAYLPELNVIGEGEIDEETTVQIVARLGEKDLGFTAGQAA